MHKFVDICPLCLSKHVTTIGLKITHRVMWIILVASQIHPLGCHVCEGGFFFQLWLWEYWLKRLFLLQAMIIFYKYLIFFARVVVIFLWWTHLKKFWFSYLESVKLFFFLAENSSALNNNIIVSCTFCGCNNCFSQLQHQVLLSISDIRQAHSGKRA